MRSAHDCVRHELEAVFEKLRITEIRVIPAGYLLEVKRLPDLDSNQEPVD